MIGNRMRAFALTTVAAILCCAPPALAARFDGAWDMLAVTTNGHCGVIKIGIAIRRGHVSSTRGSFALHKINISGHVYDSGHTLMKAVAGPRVAEGAGHFDRSKGSGRWNGTGPSGVCSGVWTAVRD
jgi:hypothetical protein